MSQSPTPQSPNTSRRTSGKESVTLQPVHLSLLSVFALWLRKEYRPLNARQSAILQTWHAFLEEHPDNFDDMVITVPDSLQELWELSFKTK